MLKLKDINIEVYKGNPLDSRKNYSRLIVHNPNPIANKNFYEDFGDVIEVKRTRGVDTVIYKSLNNILPVIEEYTKWRKNQTKKIFFFLKPNEDNLAAPSYCLLKKYFNPNEDYFKILNQLKEKYPKKVVKVIPKKKELLAKTEKVLDPLDLISTPIKTPIKTPNKKNNTPNSASKSIRDLINNSIVDILSINDEDEEEDEDASDSSDTPKKKEQTKVLKNRCKQIKQNQERCRGTACNNSEYCSAHKQKATPNKRKKL